MCVLLNLPLTHSILKAFLFVVLLLVFKIEAKKSLYPSLAILNLILLASC